MYPGWFKKGFAGAAAKTLRSSAASNVTKSFKSRVCGRRKKTYEDLEIEAQINRDQYQLAAGRLLEVCEQLKLQTEETEELKAQLKTDALQARAAYKHIQESLTRTIASLTEKANEDEAKIDSLQVNLENLMLDNEELREKLEDAEEHFADPDLVTDLKARISPLHAPLVAKTAEYEAENADLKNKLDSFEKQYENTLGTIKEEHKLQLETVKQEQALVLEAIKKGHAMALGAVEGDLKAEKDHSKSLSLQQKQDHCEAANKLKAKDKEVGQLREAQTKKDAEIAKLKAKLKAQNARIAALEAEKRDLQTKTDSLTLQQLPFTSLQPGIRV